MMRFYTLLLLLLIHELSYGQENINISSEVKQVTVYQQGAQVTREATVNIPKGTSKLVFENITGQMVTKGIQVKGDNGVTIISVSHELDYINEKEKDEKLIDFIEEQLILREEIAISKQKIALFDIEKTMILTNKSIGGKDGVSITELQKAADFFRSRLGDIQSEVLKIEKETKEIKMKLVKVSSQIMVLNNKVDLPTSKVIVVVSSNKNVNSSFKVQYIVNDAAWEPTYDVRIKNVDSPLELTYKSSIWQNTDEDWSDVKLTLSTGNPSVSNNKPTLGRYLLTYDNYYRKSTSKSRRPAQNPRFGTTSVSGRITDGAGEALIGANIYVKGSDIGTVTDFDGNYRLSIPNTFKQLVVSYVGYTTKEVTVNSNYLDIKLSEGIMLGNEVVVTGQSIRSLAIKNISSVAATASGVRSQATAYYLDGIRMRGERQKKKIKKQIPLAINKFETTISFDIEIPYTIPADNKPYDVTMVSYDIDAEYLYKIVPKLSDDAYLMARFSDWTDYHLLSGKVNLFFKGVYQGDTFLDVKSLEDTLSLSIGRDKDIVVERKLLKDYTTKKFFATSKKVQKAWEIIIKNNKSKAINLIVEDQYPISNIDDIKVELIEHSGAKVSEDTGKLTWEFDLDAKQKITKSIIYAVKYPKKKRLLVQ